MNTTIATATIHDIGLTAKIILEQLARAVYQYNRKLYVTYRTDEVYQALKNFNNQNNGLLIDTKTVKCLEELSSYAKGFNELPSGSYKDHLREHHHGKVMNSIIELEKKVIDEAIRRLGLDRFTKIVHDYADYRQQQENANNTWSKI